METLSTVLRAIRGETRVRRQHVSVFREFVEHLDSAAKRAPPRPAPRQPVNKQSEPSRRGKR